MATIELYANKINRIPGLVTGIRNETSNLKSELMTLKTKVQSINQNICNVDDVMASISASTQTQGDKIAALNNLAEDVKQFALAAERADRNVADTVNQNKEDFYEKYSYLKPFWEKNLFEQMADVGGFLLDSAVEWCQEHWKLVVTVVLVAVAIAALVFLPGLGGSLAVFALMGAAKGLITGAVIGGLIGGGINMLMGKSFLEGFEDGAFEGAISGMIFGGLSTWASGGKYFADILGKAKPFELLEKTGAIGRFKFSWMLTGNAAGLSAGGKMTFKKLALNTLFGIGSDATASIVGDTLDVKIKGENISMGEIMRNAGYAALASAVFSPISQILPSAKISKITKDNGSWKHIWATQSTRYLKYGSNIRLKTYFKGIGKCAVEKVGDLVLDISKSAINEWSKSWNLQPQH